MRESLTIHPAPQSWRSLLQHNTSPDATALRRELNLPTDKPIIMTGHQAEFWHPGILAKYLAADAACAVLNAHPAWLFVDQDRADTVELHYPARNNSTLTIGTATVRERKLPAIRDAHELVRARLDAIRSTFNRHDSAPTLSHQLATTLSDLIAPHVSLPYSTLFATELSRTTLFQSLVSTMAKDPERCITTYNAAAANHRSAGIRPLTASDIQDRWELPLWHLPPNRPRTHVYAEDLPNIPPRELAPKALFMTGLMRLAACDLFIHGMGGAGSADSSSPTSDGYDFITEEWLEQWLGIPRASLAPMTLVTATRYLPLSDTPIPSPTEVAHARWLAHHARHDPAAFNDTSAAATKQHFLDQIDLLPHHSHARHHAFRQLHMALEDARRRNSTTLDVLDQQATQLSHRLAERDILFNRTWPFPLFPETTIANLNRQIRHAFNV